MSRLLLSALLAATVFIGVCEAADTTVVVRAKSKDGKFIGSSMGGAWVMIRDAVTGRMLAQGLTEGGTGDTKRLMVESLKRGALLSDPTAAKFEATLDIDEPLLVTIDVRAPFGQRQAMVTTSTQVWLIPGKHLLGDGVTVEVPGLAVAILSPQSPEAVTLTEKKAVIPITATVVMMCGCPIEPGGLWDAGNFEVQATLRQGDHVVRTLPLTYAGKQNTFEGGLDVSAGGRYELVVYAFQPSTGNSGVDRATVVVK